MTQPVPDWYTTLTAKPAATTTTTANGATVITLNGTNTPPVDDEPVTIANPAGYVDAALEREATDLAAMAPDTGRNHQLNTAAFRLGRIIAAGLPLDEQLATTALLTACEDNGLHAEDGDHACRATIRSGLRGGARHPLPWTQPVTPPQAVAFIPPAGLTLAPPGNDPVEIEAQRQRVARAARRLVDSEEADAAFTAPAPRSLRDFLAEPDENVPYLVADVLPHGANATLTAQFKAGKTTMLTNLLRALVDNQPFLGRHNVLGDAGRVAMFDYEMTASQLRRWLREAGIQNVDAVDIVPLRGRGLALDQPRGRTWAINYLRERNIGVWIVDPFARAYLGDENDNGAVTAWTDALDIIKHAAGVHTLVMAVHTGRVTTEHTRARGATRLDDWPDVRWLFTKADDGTRYFAATGRDVDVDEVGLSYDDTTRRYTANLPGRRAGDRDKNTDRLLEVMTPYGAGPGQSQTAIAAALGWSSATTKKRIEAALSQRRIKRIGDKYWSDIPVPFDPDRTPGQDRTGQVSDSRPEDTTPVGGVRASDSPDSQPSDLDQQEGA